MTDTTSPGSTRPTGPAPADPTDAPDAPDAPDAAGQRAPRQERGRRRMDEILDAAEALVAEVGTGATSIQEIARRAGASVGSIYHFFGTKEAIFDALRARYESQAREKADEMIAGADAWAGLPLREFVERMLDPFADFLERAPVHFALATTAAGHRLPKDASTDAALRRALGALVERRYPGLTPEECGLRADVMMGIGEGVATHLARAEPAARRRLVAELKRATRGYLSTYEEPDASYGPTG